MTQALSASSLRHKVLSNNIANVNTPGFKRSDVVFEDKLAAAMGGNPRLSMTRTNEKHLPGRNDSADLSPTIFTDTTTSLRTDGSNVDIDAEMAGVAKNTLYYEAVAQQLSRYFTNLKSAIRGGAS